MNHILIEILKVVGAFLFPILFVIFFYVRGRATRAAISRAFSEQRDEEIARYFLKKEVGSRQYNKILEQIKTTAEEKTKEKAKVKERKTEEKLLKILLMLKGKITRDEIMSKLELKEQANFHNNYIFPAIKGGFIAMTMSASPSNQNQKYCLTEKGEMALNKIKKNRKKAGELLSVIKGEMGIGKIQKKLESTNVANLQKEYIKPALEDGLIEINISKFPNIYRRIKKFLNISEQYRLIKKFLIIREKYSLTKYGEAALRELKENKAKK